MVKACAKYGLEMDYLKGDGLASASGAANANAWMYAANKPGAGMNHWLPTRLQAVYDANQGHTQVGWVWSNLDACRGEPVLLYDVEESLQAFLDDGYTVFPVTGPLYNADLGIGTMPEYARITRMEVRARTQGGASAVQSRSGNRKACPLGTQPPVGSSEVAPDLVIAMEDGPQDWPMQTEEGPEGDEEAPKPAASEGEADYGGTEPTDGSSGSSEDSADDESGEEASGTEIGGELPMEPVTEEPVPEEEPTVKAEPPADDDAPAPPPAQTDEELRKSMSILSQAPPALVQAACNEGLRNGTIQIEELKNKAGMAKAGIKIVAQAGTLLERVKSSLADVSYSSLEKAGVLSWEPSKDKHGGTLKVNAANSAITKLKKDTTILVQYNRVSASGQVGGGGLVTQFQATIDAASQKFGDEVNIDDIAKGKKAPGHWCIGHVFSEAASGCARGFLRNYKGQGTGRTPEAPAAHRPPARGASDPRTPARRD